MEKERRVGRIFMKSVLFEEVRAYMETVLGAPVADHVAEEFLVQHPRVLGSIVGWGDVDEAERSVIREYCQSVLAKGA